MEIESRNTMTLGLTQSPTEMNTRNLLRGKGLKTRNVGGKKRKKERKKRQIAILE
jgi:hypothetical protein